MTRRRWPTRSPLTCRSSRSRHAASGDAAARSHGRPWSAGSADGSMSGPTQAAGSSATSPPSDRRRSPISRRGRVCSASGRSSKRCGRSWSRFAITKDANCSTCPTGRAPTRRHRRHLASCPNTTTCCSGTPTGRASSRRGDASRFRPGTGRRWARSLSTACTPGRGGSRGRAVERRCRSTRSRPFARAIARRSSSRAARLLAFAATGSEPEIVVETSPS